MNVVDVVNVEVGRYVVVLKLDEKNKIHDLGIVVGSLIKVIETDPYRADWLYGLDGVELDYVKSYYDEFSLVELGEEPLPTCGAGFIGAIHGSLSAITDSALTRSFMQPVGGDSVETLGVFRPVLEDRKIGKVRIELVDFGFPNALWEVAKVMTWAGVTKGYKDHDWQNLPGAKDAFPAAASRHRMKHIMASAAGLPLNEDGLTDEGYTDEESKFFHKAHEAFNILCELEMMMTGKITTKK